MTDQPTDAEDDAFTVHRASDGNLSIVYNPRSDCICPPGLIGLDMACRIHGIHADELDRQNARTQ